MKTKNEISELIKNKPINERIKVSKNFFLDEFIDPHTYLISEDRGLSILDFRLIKIAQRLRNKINRPLGINNWWGYFEENECDTPYDEIIKDIESNSVLTIRGKKNRIFKWSGYRPPHCKIGAKRSAHKLGQAIDPKGDENYYYEIIKNNAKEFYNLGVRRLEDINITRGWLHLDTLERNTKPNSIRVVDLVEETHTIYF